ncbi:MAG: hypothetical protein GX885_08230 [Methanomicrobiales archaeon]|nr:hypothetical protein [Methanomicrobiales archaeon]
MNRITICNIRALRGRKLAHPGESPSEEMIGPAMAGEDAAPLLSCDPATAAGIPEGPGLAWKMPGPGRLPIAGGHGVCA